MAYTEVFAKADAISKHYDAAYDDSCSKKGTCSFKDKADACDKAIAHAKGHAENYALACAESAASAIAKTKLVVVYGAKLENCLNDGKPLLQSRRTLLRRRLCFRCLPIPRSLKMVMVPKHQILIGKEKQKIDEFT